jgi:hypothetical protein
MGEVRMKASAMLPIAAGCVVFGIGMAVRDVFSDIWVRAVVAGTSAALGVGVAMVIYGYGHKNVTKEIES